MGWSFGNKAWVSRPSINSKTTSILKPITALERGVATRSLRAVRYIVVRTSVVGPVSLRPTPKFWDQDAPS